MNTLTVNYYLNTNDPPDFLGSEISSNIEQVLCPNDPAGHQITITKFFDGQTTHRWLVAKIEHPSAVEVNVFIEPRNSTKTEVFLTKTRKSHPAVIKKIQKGTLVEVEFGYVQQVKRSDGLLKTNKRYPDMLHKGEMHKRRLAIVVGTNGALVTVVPISSDDNQNLGDKSIFIVSAYSGPK